MFLLFQSYAFYFLFLLSSMMLNKSSENGHACLVPDLGRKHVVFHLGVMLAVDFFVDALYQVEEVPLYFYFSESIIHEWVLNFVRCCFCIDLYVHVLFFNLLMCWIINMVIDFQVLNQPCSLGISPTLL